MIQNQENGKKPHYGTPNFFFKNLPSSVTTYHRQLASGTISEKTNDPILRKFSDGRTDGRKDGQTETDRDRQRDGQTDRRE